MEIEHGLVDIVLLKFERVKTPLKDQKSNRVTQTLKEAA